MSVISLVFEVKVRVVVECCFEFKKVMCFILNLKIRSNYEFKTCVLNLKDKK
tara:strand:- start:377 stop:532 length:156 start_codon:yes stop_codon:yes gene_type:complete